uniref:Uncharacterized protein n=1 Tax=Brassica oleracea TaxID=3712 RepID=A0A3P6EQQ7_BRAOL|nr:unnamed protein product [Brassica oleracea]
MRWRGGWSGVMSLEEFSSEDDRSYPMLKGWLYRRSFLPSSGDERRRMRSRVTD